MNVETKIYQTADGKRPLSEWISGLERSAKARILIGIDRLEAGNFGDSKPVGEGVSERRFNFGPGYRLYYAMDGRQLVILLAGGTKKRQQNDIETAKLFWADYKARKQEAIEREKANEPKSEKARKKGKKGK